MSRFVSFPRVERSEACAAVTGGCEGREEKGTELEVLAAGVADEANEFEGVTVAGIAVVEDVFPPANALGDALEGVFKAMADLFFEEVPLDGTEALNLLDGFVVPAAEGGAGHVELGGDGVEGKALGAEFDELVFGFGAIHGS